MNKNPLELHQPSIKTMLKLLYIAFMKALQLFFSFSTRLHGISWTFYAENFTNQSYTIFANSSPFSLATVTSKLPECSLLTQKPPSLEQYTNSTSKSIENKAALHILERFYPRLFIKYKMTILNRLISSFAVVNLHFTPFKTMVIRKLIPKNNKTKG